MNRFQKTPFLAAVSLFLLVGLSSFSSKSKLSLCQANCLIEGTQGPVLNIKTKKANGQLTSATVILLYQGSSTNEYSAIGDLTTQSIGIGTHQIEISKPGYNTVNSTFEAVGTFMQMSFTLTEE